eukprot:1186000-Rhodomonas_salina.2
MQGRGPWNSRVAVHGMRTGRTRRRRRGGGVWSEGTTAGSVAQTHACDNVLEEGTAACDNVQEEERDCTITCLALARWGA